MGILDLDEFDNENVDQVGSVAQHGEEDKSEEEECSDAQHNGNFLRSLPPPVILIHLI